MTTSYTFGTVSVTAGSDMVTGSGTGWLTANVAPGFLGLDSSNGNPVPVLEVISDTSLRLVKPWRGTSASGQAYWLSYDTRDGQQTVNNAQRLAEYIARLSSPFFSALEGLTPTANTFMTFNAAGTAVLSALTAAGRSLLGVTGAANRIPFFTSSTAVSTLPITEAAKAVLAQEGVADQFSYYTGPGSVGRSNLTELGRLILASGDVLSVVNRFGPVFGGSAPAPSEAGVGMSDGDFDTVIIPGLYTIAGSWINGPTSSGASSYAGVLTVKARRFNNGYWQESQFTNGNTYVRSTTTPTSWGPWVLLPRETLGTVSQSGGVPSGAIFERGSNANGEYVRFADGTQICLCATVSIDITSSVSPLFRSDVVPATYPVSFATNPWAFGFISNTVNSWINPRSTSSSEAGVIGWSTTSRSGDQFRVGAIGRWF